MTSLRDLHIHVNVRTLKDRARRLAICPLAAGSAATSSKQFCQTCEASMNLTVNTRRYCDVYESVS